MCSFEIRRFLLLGDGWGFSRTLSAVLAWRFACSPPVMGERGRDGMRSLGQVAEVGGPEMRMRQVEGVERG